MLRGAQRCPTSSLLDLEQALNLHPCREHGGELGDAILYGYARLKNGLANAHGVKLFATCDDGGQQGYADRPAHVSHHVKES